MVAVHKTISCGEIVSPGSVKQLSSRVHVLIQCFKVGVFYASTYPVSHICLKKRNVYDSCLQAILKFDVVFSIVPHPVVGEGQSCQLLRKRGERRSTSARYASEAVIDKLQRHGPVVDEGHLHGSPGHTREQYTKTRNSGMTVVFRVDTERRKVVNNFAKYSPSGSIDFLSMATFSPLLVKSNSANVI